MSDTREAHKVKLSDYGFTILQIESMQACNMKCKFCAYPLIQNKGTQLSDEEVYKVINSIDPKDDMVEYVCFNQYNEPLLDKRIFDFIKYANATGFKTLVITNGLAFISPAIIEKLILAAPTYIKISFQTLNKESFKSRGIDFSFEKYKRAIFEFLDASLKHNSPSKITIDLACNFMSRWDRI